MGIYRLILLDFWLKLRPAGEIATTGSSAAKSPVKEC
jgi:hypothetical protein